MALLRYCETFPRKSLIFLLSFWRREHARSITAECAACLAWSCGVTGAVGCPRSSASIEGSPEFCVALAAGVAAGVDLWVVGADEVAVGREEVSCPPNVLVETDWEL